VAVPGKKEEEADEVAKVEVKPGRTVCSEVLDILL